MRLYGGRYLKNRTSRAISAAVESRDAIVWDVDNEDKVARVKIQGSNTYVIAHYPENWESNPVWLKPGNAVRISHVGGMRGRIELTGHGTFVPSPVAGGAAAPAVPAIADSVLTGLNILTTLDGNPARRVLVKTGTWSIAGVPYALGPITMGAGYTLGNGGGMGSIGATVTLGSVAGTYRYDYLYIGSNGIIDVVPGTDADPPGVPSAPAAHACIGYVLSRAGTATPLPGDVNRAYTAATASYLTIAVSDSELTWGTELTATVTITIKDQFGSAMTPPAGSPWPVDLAFFAGNGTITDNTGQSSTVSRTAYTATSAIVFTYTRGGTAGDESPCLKATLVNKGLSGATVLTLLDSGGYPM